MASRKDCASYTAKNQHKCANRFGKIFFHASPTCCEPHRVRSARRKAPRLAESFEPGRVPQQGPMSSWFHLRPRAFYQYSEYLGARLLSVLAGERALIVQVVAFNAIWNKRLVPSHGASHNYLSFFLPD